jgi:hypothetical protein
MRVPHAALDSGTAIDFPWCLQQSYNSPSASAKTLSALRVFFKYTNYSKTERLRVKLYKNSYQNRVIKCRIKQGVCFVSILFKSLFSVNAVTSIVSDGRFYCTVTVLLRFSFSSNSILPSELVNVVNSCLIAIS